MFGSVIITDVTGNDQRYRIGHWFGLGERFRFSYWFGHKRLGYQFNRRHQNRHQNKERNHRIWYKKRQ
jgi:hypothetical protein